MGFIRERKLKNGNTRFQAEIRLKGISKSLTAVFDRKTDAKAWIQKVEADIRCGRQQLYAEGRRHTFAEAVERYRKEQTVSVVKKGHLDWWQKELGSLYLQDVRPAVISEKKQKLLSTPTSTGIIRSKSTCNRYLATLSHLLSICVKQWEWLSENPARKISREKEPRERTRFLTPEERQNLLKTSLDSDNPYLYIFVVLLLSTGCRYNEIRCLKWTDVDLFQGKITITKSKNSDMRSLPIRGPALELIRDLAAQNQSIGYVFPSPTTKSRPIELRRAFRTAIKRAGLKNFRGHDCRHSYATEMLAQGLSLGEIGILLGHRSVSMTRRYAHLVESRSIDAVSKMSEQIFQGVGNG
jgi:integrase